MILVLVGFMGAGKTTVGRIISEKSGLTFIDTDAAIEAQAGVPIASIFAERGEIAFREIERVVVQDALRAADGVVALGGGALDDPTVMTALEWATVIHLDVRLTEALRRTEGGTPRPMLSREEPSRLFAARRPRYEAAVARARRGWRVDTTGRTPEDVALEIADLVGIELEGQVRRVTVAAPSRTYDAVIGAGISRSLGAYLPSLEDAERALVLSHDALVDSAEDAAAQLRDLGVEPEIALIPEGEAAKSPSSVIRLWNALAEGGFHRRDMVVAVGGGVVSDVAGVVAGTFHRGMRLVLVPTTLLAQADAAVGGKNAINLATGKNLVGTIHQPELVVCDVSLLDTLPDAEVRSGLAEVVKHGLIAAPDLLDAVVRRADLMLKRDHDSLVAIVARSLAVKAAVVASDEREAGPRAHLNYGHTFGHAIEHVAAGALRHGEAVALGMVAAAHAAHDVGLLDPDGVARHVEVLEAIGLPTRADFGFEDLTQVWARDKKYRRGVRFVLLAGIGRPRAGVALDDAVLRRALARLAGR